MAPEAGELERPWLYAELHEKTTLDEVTKAVFQVPKLPDIKGEAIRSILGPVSNSLTGYLFIHVHQAQTFLDRYKVRRRECELAAWDFGEEVTHELLVAFLLTRIGAVPQSVTHLRRAIELVVEGSFLSTSFLESETGIVWNPFGDLYLSNLWRHYATRRPLRAREVIDRVKADGKNVTEALRGFTAFYADRFVSRYCGSHTRALEKTHANRGLARPVASASGRPTHKCDVKACEGPATTAVAERVPSFELMREVLKAKLKTVGYSDGDDLSCRSLYDKSSAYVHVTREAHKHGPGWELEEVTAWSALVRELTVWAAKAGASLWRLVGADLPGLVELLESIEFDVWGQNWTEMRTKNKVCSLFLARPTNGDRQLGV